MKNKTSSLEFTFANIAEGEFAPEVGKITVTVTSDCESAHEVLKDLDLEEEFCKFLQDKFCAEGGRVVTSELAKILASAEE